MDVTIQFCAIRIYTRAGGIERFNQRVVTSVRGMCRQERAVIHVLGDQPEHLPEANRRTIEGFAGRRLPFVLHSLIFALRKADVLMIGHINLLPIVFFAKLLRPRLKTLLFVHGIEIWDSREFRRKRFYEPWMLQKFVSRVASVSRFTADKLCTQFGFPRSRISILPNAVDRSSTDDLSCSMSPNLLTVTRLSAGEQLKNVDKIIYALAALKPHYPMLMLEVVGDGELLDDMKKLATKLKLDERVRFLGRVSDAELNAAYRRASIFVLPSVKEGFGIVYLEAWRQGLAIIGANAGATPEVIQNEVDGLLVDPGNPNALAEAIERLVRDVDLRRRLALAGRRKVEEKYQHEHFFANLNEIVSELMRSS